MSTKENIQSTHLESLHTIDVESNTSMISEVANLRNLEATALRMIDRAAACRMEKSPTLRVSCQGRSTSAAVLDSGAEINGMDAAFAQMSGVKFSNSLLTAKSAGKHLLHMKGESERPVLLVAEDSASPCTLNLGKIMIIQDKKV